MQRRLIVWSVNYELETMWNKAIVAWLKVLSSHLAGGTEEDNENLGHD